MEEQTAKPMETEVTGGKPEGGDAMATDSPATTPVVAPSSPEAEKQDNGAAPMQVEQPPKQEVLVLGIDFGTQKCVAAVSTTSSLFPNIVRNNLANQVTPNVLSFREKRRLIGEEALSAITRSPDATLHSIKRFLGRDIQEVQQELTFLPYSLEDQGEYVAFKVYSSGEVRSYRPEQATAMMLKQLRTYTEQNYGSGAPCKGTVLAVPGCFTLKQRRALVDAAAIAGLDVLDVIDDVTAVALCYGVRRREGKDTPKTEEEKPENILFIDMGHSFFSAKVVAFTKNKLKVLSSVSDQSAGARGFDFNLVNHFAAELKQKYGVDPFQSFRILAKLTEAAEKAKKVLSTIDETPLEVENVGDADFRGKISKAKFEELSRALLATVGSLVERVVSEAGLKPDDLQAVEVVGGGTRIPCVQDTISKALGGKPLGKTLDSAGSVAIGATVMATIVCPDLTFEYVVEDGREGIGAITALEGGTPKVDIEKYSLMEEEMRKSEQVIIATNDKKNALEQYIYNRRQLCDEQEYSSYINAEEKEKVFKILDDAWAWVDEIGDNGDLAAFTEKYDSLTKAVDEAAPRLRDRLHEQELERQKALKEAEELANKPAEENPDKKPRSKKQKLETAEKRKNQGNILFKEFDYEGAAKRYTEGLGYLADLYDLTPTETETVKVLKLSLHLNIAASCMKIRRFKQAQENCTEALKLDSANVKAMFRRSQAHTNQNNLDEAKKDLEAALKVAPDDADVKKEHARVLRLIQQQKEKEKKMYSKMFS